ncbi:MAG: alanine racemase, partial [Polaromonas sp.]
MPIEALETPALLLDEARMARNIARMQAQLQRLGVAFRPHVKTNKSMDVTRRLMSSPIGPITISTLKEAEYFAAHGVRDMLYAVSIAPNKFAHALKLQRSGVRLTLILDSMETAELLAAFAKAHDASFEIMLEIDSDGHRSGLVPDAPELVPIATYLHNAGLVVRGVMTHAGSSYDCPTLNDVRALAERERAAVVNSAQRLRAAGLACP